MGLRLAILTFWLRLLEKPALARMKDPALLRRRFDAVARRVFVMPSGVEGAAETLGGVPCVRYGEPTTATLLHFHGGAFIAGSWRTHGHLAAWLGRAAGCSAVLPSYRLVPEHPFPAAVDDGLAVYAALRARGPVVLSGDSAGGGLVFAVLIAARAAGLADPAACVAFSPWADLSLSGDSLRRNARHDAMLPAERLAEVAERYLDGADPRDPRASPVYMTLDHPPPPTFITHAATEILADDATSLAATLAGLGGAVITQVHPSAPHAWPIFAGLLPEADDTIRRAGDFMRQQLGTVADQPTSRPTFQG